MEALDITLGNITMLNAVIPSYNGEDEEEVISADDPKNKERINQILGF